MASSILESVFEFIQDATANLESPQVQQLTGERFDSVEEFMRKTEHTGPKNYGRGFLAGVLGGIVGVGIKMLVDRAVAPDTVQLEDQLSSDIVDSAEDAMGVELSDTGESVAETIVEVGMGALIGGIYGLIVEAMPEANTKDGSPAWTAAQQFAGPALGLIPAAAEEIARDRAQNLAGHVAFGATAEIVRRTARYYMEQQ